jgi:hypothetical protein
MAADAIAEDLAGQSRFSFRGTVQKLGAVTMPQISVTDRTVVVRVEEVIHAPEALGNWTGKEITVLLGEGEQVHEGEQVIFFTNGRLYGSSIAVQSIGHRPVEASHPAEVLANRDLRAHIDDADLVVTGQVTAVRLPEAPAGRAVAGPLPRRRFSEHDPQWREAVVQIESVDKGDHPAQEVIVNFSASTDVAWYRAPKLQAGHEGVFLLHRHEGGEPTPAREAAAPSAAPPAPTGAYTVLHPLDFQPKDKLEQIRSHIRGTSSSGSTGSSSPR